MYLNNWIYKKLICLYRRLAFDQKDQYDNIALNYMLECKKIVDVGCGTGRFISKSPERIMGVEHNQDSVEECLKKGYNVVKADVKKLPFDNESFDGVHCSHVIEHLQPKDAYKLLSEIVRVLKKNGILVIRTPMLYPGFYDDFTHVKPYHPKALLHYLTTYEKSEQTTLTPIKGKFKVLKLKYRKAPLFLNILDTPLFFIFPLFNFFYRFRISSLKKTGYMLILKKLE